MQIRSQLFGRTEKGEITGLYTLSNDSGASVKITNYGGIITDINVPDKNGTLVNVVLGFDKLEDYISDNYKNSNPYFGAIIGRFTNRIDKGRFDINGKSYQIPCKHGEYSLHGGIEGFDQKVWKAETETSENTVSLKLTYLSKHLEEGFPGNLNVMVKYSWNNNCELSIEYMATTDRATHLNLTNHTYFNLNGGNTDVLEHEVVIHADTYTEVDENSIPTGKFQSVEGSCMDFRTPHKIGEQIEKADGNGYDHNYVINHFDGKLREASEVFDLTSGIKLKVLTTEPGVQFYTANYMDGTLSRDDVIFASRMGFCIETQHFPDSPNKPEFPSTLLKPGDEFKSKTIYKFSIQ